MRILAIVITVLSVFAYFVGEHMVYSYLKTIDPSLAGGVRLIVMSWILFSIWKENIDK